MKRVLGVDPGGTTGSTTVAFGPDGYSILAAREYSRGSMEIVRMVGEDIQFRVLAAVAIERFVIGNRSGRSSSAAAGDKARDIIGGVTAAARAANVRVVKRSAADVKRWAMDKRLKAAGLWEPTANTSNHHDARDAARHALMSLVFDFGCPDPLSPTYRPERG